MKKRIVSTLLSAIMLIGIIPLSSCGEKAPEPEKSKVDHVYKATNIDIGDNINPNQIINAGNKVLVYAYETISKDPYESQNLFLSIDPETGDFTKTVYEKDEDDNGYIQNITADNAGNPVFLVQNYDSETGTQSYRVDRMLDGKIETMCDDLNSLFEVSEDNPSYGRYFYIDNFLIDGNGNAYFANNNLIVVCDNSFNKLFQITIDGYIRGIGVTADGRAYVSFRDNTTYSYKICYIDTEKKEIGDPLALPNLASSNSEFYVGKGYDIYYNDGSSIYGFNEADEGSVELLNFINSDINPNAVRDLVIVNEDTFICYCYDYQNSEETTRELLLLERVPEEEIQEKYVIKVAYMPDGRGNLEYLAVKFNRASDEYRVELINYSKYRTDDGNTGNDQLESEILAGTAPDIIELESFKSSDNWIAQGAFTDLSKLIEKDESFDRSKYFESVLDAYTDSKGRMYQFVTEFYLGTILVNPEFVKFDSWNAEDFIKFASELPEGTYLTEYINRQTMLYFSLACSLDSFIDYENATCSFDSDSFKKLLEVAKSIPGDFNYYSMLSDEEMAVYNEDRYKPYREGKMMLTDETIYGLDSYVEATVRYGKDADTKIIGYPTNTGNGAIIQPNKSYAINDKSLLKDGAWEFTKTIPSLSSERSSYGISLCIDTFEKNCENDLGTWNYIYSNGGMGFGGDYTYEEAWERVQESLKRNNRPDNGVLVQTSKEHIEAVKELINGAQALPNLEDKVFKIINEEAELYYSDDKSLDETVKIIQDRISTYISENS